MRVLLLGCTGSLGTRCVQALLAHRHTVILYVRNPTKLRALVTPSVMQEVTAVVIGDATDASGIQKAMQDYVVDAVVNVAGNQVLPWQEQILPRIAKAVTKAAVEAGRKRGSPLRAWLVSGINILDYPEAPGLLTDHLGFIIRMAAVPHIATRDVVQAVPVRDLHWSLICVAMMFPSDPKQKTFDVLESPRGHSLSLKASEPPGWKNTWLLRIPLIGFSLNLWWLVIRSYWTVLEDVADFLAEDLASHSTEWVGQRVGMKDKTKGRRRAR